MNEFKAKLQELSKNKTVVYGICAVLAVFIVFRFYQVLFHKPVTTKDVPYVRTTTIGMDNGDTYFSYPGEVRGRHESVLAFQAAGKIVTRKVNLGDSVKAGQILMTLDPKDIQQNVFAADADVSKAQSAYKLALDNARRYDTLYEKGAVSQLVRDQNRTQLDAAESALQQAEAKATAAHNQLDYTQLKSDHDGVVASLSGEVGMVIAAGTPVVTVVQSGEQEIQIYVPENQLGNVKPGQQANVTFWALENTSAQGTITEIASMADSVTRTYKVRVSVPSMPPAARLGMTAKVSIRREGSAEILLPRSAIYCPQNVPYVWVVSNSARVTKREVVLGQYKNSEVVVKEGLKAGDIVVIAGISKLTEGMTVSLEAGGAK